MGSSIVCDFVILVPPKDVQPRRGVATLLAAATRVMVAPVMFQYDEAQCATMFCPDHIMKRIAKAMNKLNRLASKESPAKYYAALGEVLSGFEIQLDTRPGIVSFLVDGMFESILFFPGPPAASLRLAFGRLGYWSDIRALRSTYKTVEICESEPGSEGITFRVPVNRLPTNSEEPHSSDSEELHSSVPMTLRTKINIANKRDLCEISSTANVLLLSVDPNQECVKFH